jgi:hypothetical protein
MIHSWKASQSKLLLIACCEQQEKIFEITGSINQANTTVIKLPLVCD